MKRKLVNLHDKKRPSRVLIHHPYSYQNHKYQMLR